MLGPHHPHCKEFLPYIQPKPLLLAPPDPPMTWSSSCSVSTLTSCSALAAFPLAAVANCCNVPNYLSCAFSSVTINVLFMTDRVSCKQEKFSRLDCLVAERKLNANPSSELTKTSKTSLFFMLQTLTSLFLRSYCFVLGRPQT